MSELEDKQVSVGEAHDSLTELASVLMDQTSGSLLKLANEEDVDVVMIVTRPSPIRKGYQDQGMGTTITDPAELAHVLAHALQGAVDPEIIAEVIQQVRKAGETERGAVVVARDHEDGPDD